MARKKRQQKLQMAELSPQGEDGGAKRTPLSTNDIAAGREKYEVKEVKDKAQRRGVLMYQIGWVGWDRTYDTWEPINHLVGAEQKLRECEEKRDAETE